MTSTDGIVIDERLVIRSDASGPSRRGWCCRTPASTSPCSRSPAAGSCARAWATSATTSRWCSTSPPTISASAGSTPSRTWPRSRGRRRGGPPRWLRRAQRRRCARAAMGRRCSGDVVWFSMADGTDVREMIDEHCRGGGRARPGAQRPRRVDRPPARPALDAARVHPPAAAPSAAGPGSTCRTLAAAAAAFAAGAHLHDIRQGLRTFSTSYYLSPGRLNQIEVAGARSSSTTPTTRRACGCSATSSRRWPRRRRPPPTWRARSGSASSRRPATAATRTCASSGGGRRALRRPGRPRGRRPARAGPRRRRRARRRGRAGPDGRRGALQAGRAGARRDPGGP